MTLTKTKLAPGFWRFTDGRNAVIVERLGDGRFDAYDATGRLGRCGYIPWDARPSYAEAAARALAVIAADNDDEQHASECAHLARLAVRCPEFATEQGFRVITRGIPAYRCAHIFNRAASGVDFRGCGKAHLARVWTGSESYPSRVARNEAVIGLIAEQGRPGTWRNVFARLEARRPIPKNPSPLSGARARLIDRRRRARAFAELQARIAAAKAA